MLQSMTQKFIILTDLEIQKWNEDSLDFFMNQKELKNDIIGNFLREKTKALIAQITLRFNSIFQGFCKQIM